MTPTLLVAAVARRAEKNHQKTRECFWKRKTYAIKLYITLYL